MNINYIKSILNYDPISGIVLYKRDIKRGSKAGTIAGTITKSNHLRIRVQGERYLLHRVIWAMQTGKELEITEQIDHINHDGLDNSWINLRVVSAKENGRNKSKSKANTSGATGVCFRNNKWRARIKVDGTYVHLGTFVEFHEAVNARKNAEVLYGFHENHGN